MSEYEMDNLRLCARMCTAGTWRHYLEEAQAICDRNGSSLQDHLGRELTEQMLVDTYGNDGTICLQVTYCINDVITANA